MKNTELVGRPFVCCPNKHRIPEAIASWQLINCPKCGAECWMQPQAKEMLERGVAEYACTDCTIRMLGQDPKKYPGGQHSE